MLKYTISFLFIFLVSFPNLFGQEEILFNDDQEILKIKDAIMLFSLPKDTLNSEQALISEDFELQKSGVPNLGISDQVHWLKIKVKNASNSEELILELAQSTIESVVLFSVFDGDIFSEESLFF